MLFVLKRHWWPLLRFWCSFRFFSSVHFLNVSFQDISDRLWMSCNDVSALVSSLYHICRYDLLEQHLGLCVAHSMEQVGTGCQRIIVGHSITKPFKHGLCETLHDSVTANAVPFLQLVCFRFSIMQCFIVHNWFNWYCSISVMPIWSHMFESDACD